MVRHQFSLLRFIGPSFKTNGSTVDKKKKLERKHACYRKIQLVGTRQVDNLSRQQTAREVEMEMQKRVAQHCSPFYIEYRIYEASCCRHHHSGVGGSPNFCRKTCTRYLKDALFLSASSCLISSGSCVSLRRSHTRDESQNLTLVWMLNVAKLLLDILRW